MANNELNLAILWIHEIEGTKPGYKPIANVCTCDDPEKVQRVDLDNLNPKYFYLSNKRSHFFTHNKEIGQAYRIVHSAYFGVGVSSVVAELGLKDDLNEKMPVLLKVFSQVAEKLHQFGIDTDKDHTVLKTIRDQVSPTNEHSVYFLDGSPSQSLEHAIDNSLQKLQAGTHRKGVHEKVVSIKNPKTPYFLHLVNQRYPISTEYRTYDALKGKECGTGKHGALVDSQTATELVDLANSKAGFIEFEATYTDKLHHDNMPLGKEVSNSKHRMWATLVEAVDMLNYCTLKLGNAYITDAGKLPNFPEQPPANTKFVSYTNGLVNEIMWLSMSYHSKRDTSISPIAAYVRAYDRVLCRQKAINFINKGYKFTGFVSGTIRFAMKLDEHRIENFTQMCREEGLIPQINII
ncbi:MULTISPECIES: hypothetical protein [Vibrio]|uniref:hypothetical protein n=1 Tax=Vibrio TaxID=662 RepID=UPI0020755C2C|nr:MULTISPECIES: hypothetical protein [Vibrio]USD35504.1 hypothetical protein J8Z27_23070 [Vibrio sp. SCSIO 43186]USD72628.1 hypothetical protein J4N41_23075 [Vibrio sp. SCSIO 43139]USD99019.1 hypothetical protein CTT30_23385 [Vibrio coralliilyticus]